MRTQAIILKKQAVNEFDQQVTCYTEEFGKLTAVAKSALKSNSIQAMHLDVFNLVDFELVSGKGMPIITGAQADETFPRLKANLLSMAVAYLFVETIDKLAFDYQKDEELWKFTLSLITQLNNDSPSNGEADIHNFLRLKQIEFLKILGYAPNLDAEPPRPVLDGILESLAGKRLFSLSFIKTVLE
jgi:DNA repair protein RecO